MPAISRAWSDSAVTNCVGGSSRRDAPSARCRIAGARQSIEPSLASEIRMSSPRAARRILSARGGVVSSNSSKRSWGSSASASTISMRTRPRPSSEEMLRLVPGAREWPWNWWRSGYRVDLRASSSASALDSLRRLADSIRARGSPPSARSWTASRTEVLPQLFGPTSRFTLASSRSSYSWKLR